MTKATENELSSLHAELAKAYKRMLKGEELSPALLTSVSNFLKHNNISCDAEQDDTMLALRDRAREALKYPFDPKKDIEGLH